MSENPLSTDTNSLISRAKSIVMSPKTEWPVIAAETKSTNDILIKYALPLILISPIASFIGSQLFGYGALGITFKPSVTGSLIMAITTLVMAVVQLFVISFVANFLSPKFGGKDRFPDAFKLVAYSMTAAWLAGIFGLVPALSILAIVGLYSFYLFYVGATPMLGVPVDKAVGFTVVTVVVTIVVMVVLNLITGAIAGSAIYGAAYT